MKTVSLVQLMKGGAPLRDQNAAKEKKKGKIDRGGEPVRGERRRNSGIVDRKAKKTGKK